MPQEERKIIHIDMDCFFIAVEMRDFPELRGVPAAVGGMAQRRGVISTSNYEARKFGVRSALSSAKAIQLCPHLKIVPGRYALYKEESEKIRSVFREFTDLIEPLSLDEAFLDVTACERFDGSATKIAYEIRRRIFEETKLTASAGIAPNKFLAKVASEWNKPNGQKTISPKDVDGFVKELEIENIFGVGKVTAHKMKKLGLNTCSDIQKWDLYKLSHHFGKWGLQLYNLSRGVDRRPVVVDSVRKSLSVERTFSEDFEGKGVLLLKIESIYEEFLKRYESKEIPLKQIKSLFIKVKFFDFKQSTHEITWAGEFSLDDFKNLFISFHANDEKNQRPVRLLGLGVRLYGEPQHEQLILDV